MRHRHVRNEWSFLIWHYLTRETKPHHRHRRPTWHGIAWHFTNISPDGMRVWCCWCVLLFACTSRITVHSLNTHFKHEFMSLRNASENIFSSIARAYALAHAFATTTTTTHWGTLPSTVAGTLNGCVHLRACQRAFLGEALPHHRTMTRLKICCVRLDLRAPPRCCSCLLLL